MGPKLAESAAESSAGSASSGRLARWRSHIGRVVVVLAAIVVTWLLLANVLASRLAAVTEPIGGLAMVLVLMLVPIWVVLFFIGQIRTMV